MAQPNSNQHHIVIYAHRDVMLIFRRHIYAEAHQHYALQLTIGLEDEFEAAVDEQQQHYQGILIDQNQPHVVFGQEQWVATLLINPETVLARDWQENILCGDSHQPLSGASITTAAAHLHQVLTDAPGCTTVGRVLDEVLPLLGGRELATTTLDPRIAEALEIIQNQPDKLISTQALANQLFLSEGRFGHLFKDELGIPLRRYLLWHRLLAGMSHISEGADFTTAAHTAGFTDLAHFSRTCRLMFGLSLSDLFAKQELAQIQLCEELPLTYEGESNG